MEKEQFGVIVSEKRYLEMREKSEAYESRQEEKESLEKEKLTKPDAAKLIGRSLPYLNKLIRDGILKQYGFGKRGKFLLKTEVLEAIRNSNL